MKDRIYEIFEEYNKLNKQVLCSLDKNYKINRKNNNEKVEDNLQNAFAEVYDILNHLDNSLKQKIPNKFMNLLDKNRNHNYIVEFDYKKDINKQKMLENTKILLAIVYRDLIGDKNDRQRYENRKIKYEENKKKKYEIKWENTNNLKKSTDMVAKNNSLESVKKKWYQKIFSLFKINKELIK